MHVAINPRYEDWDWTPRTANRFAFWGNGLTIYELHEDKDTTWFLSDPDRGYETLLY